jgi:transposase
MFLPLPTIDQFIEVTLAKCPVCACLLEEDEKVITNQQIEIAAKPFIVTEYHRHTYWYPVCQTYHTAPVAEQARSGLF